MKLTKAKLKQLIKEEYTKILTESFARKFEKLKNRLQQEWEANDQQASVTQGGQYRLPQEIAAEILQSSNFEDEDMAALLDDAVEEYNATHEDEIYVDFSEVMDVLQSTARADHYSRLEDEATNPW